MRTNDFLELAFGQLTLRPKHIQQPELWACIWLHGTLAVQYTSCSGLSPGGTASRVRTSAR